MGAVAIALIWPLQENSLYNLVFRSKGRCENMARLSFDLHEFHILSLLAMGVDQLCDDEELHWLQ